MRILLRSDAGDTTGTGHVMRCLTLAEELRDRGHEVAIQGTVSVSWLAAQLDAAGVEHLPSAADRLDVDDILAGAWDVVVVDSYRIPAPQVSSLARSMPVLAIIDGDDRGIDASWFVDPNLGAEHIPRRDQIRDRLSAGSGFALVRRSVVELRRDDRWRAGSPPRMLVVFGGSDPSGAMLRLAPSLAPMLDRVDTTVVVADAWMEQVSAELRGRTVRLIPPTPRLHTEFDRTDLMISAAGTSAWEVTTIGIPAVFAAVVANQRDALEAIVTSGVGAGVDASEHIDRISEAADLAADLLADEAARRVLVERSLAVFDGRGAGRVAEAVEGLADG